MEKRTNTKLFIALSALVLSTPMAVQAHGCSGEGACSTNTTSTTTNWTPEMQQHQSQDSSAQSQANGRNDNALSASTANQVLTTNSSRALSVRPVQVAPPVIAVPAAGVTQLAGADCGPRMIVTKRNVQAINNRLTETEKIEAGVDEFVIPDRQEPYRRVDIMPGVFQLIGHRIIETSAVVSTSTGYGIGFGGNGNGGGGGSFGMQSGGQLQRLVTTIRLAECVAYEVDTRVYKLKG